MDDKLRTLLFVYAAVALADVGIAVLRGRVTAKAIAQYFFAVWVVGVPLLAVGGFFFPAIFFPLMLVGVVAVIRPPKSQRDAGGRLHTLRHLVVFLLLLGAAGAPLRALGLALHLHLPAFEVDALFEAPFVSLGPRPIAWFDLTLGACGVFAGIVGGGFAIGSIRRKARQVALLPTSKVRSVAMGLVELRGTVRAEPDAGETTEPSCPPRIETSGDQSVWSDLEDLWRRAVLFDGRATQANREKKAADASTRSKRTSFYLEDETGRVRIDPRDATFWDGGGGLAAFTGESPLSLHLPRRSEKLASGWRNFAYLLPGDPVYLLGSVELDPEAGPAAVDSERLVVRPRARPRRGLLERLSSLEGFKRVDDEHVFYLTSLDEGGAARALRAAAGQSMLIAAFWLCASLWLVSARTDGFARIPEGWRSEASVRRSEDREAVERARALAWIGPNSKAPLPELDALLRSDDANERRYGVTLHLKLASEEAAKVRSAIPALIEFVTLDPLVPFVDPDGRVQSALRRLGDYGPEARVALPVLLDCMRNPNWPVARQALWAALKIAPKDDALAETVEALLETANPPFRDELLRARARFAGAR